MKQLLKEQIFGEIPDDFDALLIKACHEEPEPRRYPTPARALVIALCILLLAGTALAVVQGLKIADLFGIGNVDPQEAEKVIDTAVVQSGGSTSIADFTVSEAFYDGSFLRFMIECTPKEEAVLRNAAFAMLKEDEDTINLPGPRYGVEAVAHSPQIDKDLYVSVWPIDGTLYIYDNDFFPDGLGMDAVDLSIDITLLDIDDGSLLDSTTLDFTVNKTATPITRIYDLAFDTDYVRLEKVSIAQTPLETVVSLEYRPLLRAFGSFTVVPTDGYIINGDFRYHYGNTGTIPDLADGGRTTMQYMLPVEQGEENVLTLWVTNTNQGVEIDLDTGEASVFTARVISEADSVKIEKVED